MIVVMGATGRTGGEIVRQLLAAGEQVRAVGRSAVKLAELARAGADTRAGDASDAAFLTDAFRGASAAFTLLPYDVTASDYFANQAAKGEAIIRAVSAARVGYVVAFSGLGADQPSGTGFVASLHAQEARLRALHASDGTNVLILRSGALFENLFGVLAQIRHAGLVADSLSPDLPIPMISTRDVASAAASALTTRDWRGIVVRELLGERELSYAEVTRIIGDRIGRPELAYVQAPERDVVAALVKEGWSDEMAALYVELNRAIDSARVRSLEGRGPANTTETPFEVFADELALIYRS